jgi:hypothetical protein
MRNRRAKKFSTICPALLILLVGLVLWCFSTFQAAAQTNASTEDKKLELQEKEGCIRNLKLIYEAIQAYRIDHKDIPNWLSDLYPQYITDANVLICPECKRTGQAELSPLADPKLPCSYLYEFCPVPLGTNELPNVRGKTRREMKRRQMGLVGSVVPIVRCKHHTYVLNLAFNGQIYESGDDWKPLFTNLVSFADLTPQRIFADANAAARPAGLFFLQRSPKARPNQISLTDFYNAMLTQSWTGGQNNDLRPLPMGLQNFDGIDFDVRGLIQLSSKSNSIKKFPAQVKGIPVKQKCQRLNFLHAAAFAEPANDGVQVGTYIVHYAANRMQLEVPIICGRDVRDWHIRPGEKPGAPELTVAWTGTNTVSKTPGHPVRLFKTTWENLVPGVEIESVDFISAMGEPAPFLVAITAE